MGKASRRKRERREREGRGGTCARVPVGVPAVAGQCVYCCTGAATTRDHIPPKALLIGVPGDRVTVPSCDDCNRGSSADDEYLRLTLVMNIQAGDHPAARAAWEKAWRGLQRPQAAGFKRALFDSVTPVDVVDGAGETKRVLGYETTASRQARVAARIARALYYHETGGALPDHHVFAWPSAFLVQKELGERRLTDACVRMANYARSRPGTEVGAGVLTYWWQTFGRKYVVWWLLFYRGMPFLAMAFPKTGKPYNVHWRPFEFPPPPDAPRATSES